MIADQKKFEIATENVTVSANLEHTDLFQMKQIDERWVIVIAVEGNVYFNCVDVATP